MLEKLVIYMKKTENRTPLSFCTKFNSKWIKDLNVRPQPLKLLQGKIAETLENIGIGDYFLNRIPIAQEIRPIIDKLDYIKFKSLYISKETPQSRNNPQSGRKSLPAIQQINIQHIERV
jgi:hypothetical protein